MLRSGRPAQARCNRGDNYPPPGPVVSVPKWWTVSDTMGRSVPSYPPRDAEIDLYRLMVHFL